MQTFLFISNREGLRMWKTIFLVMLVLMFGGCAAKYHVPDDIQPTTAYIPLNQQSEYGEVVFVKDYLWVDTGHMYGLKIDGKYIGSIDTEGVYFIAQLKPGKHELMLFHDRRPFTRIVKQEKFTISAGQRKFFSLQKSDDDIRWKENVRLDDKIFAGFIRLDTGTNVDYPAQNKIAYDKKTAPLPSKGITLPAPTAIDKLITEQNKPVNYNQYALIIGISDYKHQTNVAYADNSARSFKLAATHILGIPEENILFLLDDEATSGAIKSNLGVCRVSKQESA